MMINNPFLMITSATTWFTNGCAVLHFPSWSIEFHQNFMISWFYDHDQYFLVDHHHYHHHHYDHHHHHYQVHQWMCTVRIGKFIQEYAAVYLTAGLENILVCNHVEHFFCNHVNQPTIILVIMILQEETLNLCLAAAPEVTTAVLEQVNDHSLVVIVIIIICRMIVIVNRLQYGSWPLSSRWLPRVLSCGGFSSLTLIFHRVAQLRCLNLWSSLDDNQLWSSKESPLITMVFTDRGILRAPWQFQSASTLPALRGFD